MDLTPILEAGCLPLNNLWYVLGTNGESPSMRVGHTACFVKKHRKVFIIAGANPDGAFAEYYSLCTRTFTWDKFEAPDQMARYEHCSFTSCHKPNRVHVFAGANMTSNYNDLIYFDAKSSRWKFLTSIVQGVPPSARTYHMSDTCCYGDKMFVFSGGQSGDQPTLDQKVHVLDMQTNSWQQLETKGSAPSPRQGHVVVAADGCVVVHGGMKGSIFYDTTHILDLVSLEWSQINVSVKPSARAGHGAVLYDNCVYIFGGMDATGALCDLYKLDLISKQWSQINYDGIPPPSRLSFACCVMTLTISDQENDNKQHTVSLFLINGGMDTLGNVFDDSLVFVLNSQPIVEAISAS